MAARKREIAGQLIYDKPHCCMFCRRYYTRRHKLEVWHTERDSQTGQLTHKKEVVRICATTPETKDKGVIVGCYEMGLARLFKQIKRGVTA